MKKIFCLCLTMLIAALSLTVNISFADTVEIREHLRSMELGSPFNYRNLTIVPIYAMTIKDRNRYLTLDEAVNKGYLTITELEGGRVPQVRLVNNSDQYIILVAGEILTGCRQDRLVGKDALIGPKTKDLILPVYCSEHGRWTAKSSSFGTEHSQAEPYLRAQIYNGKSQNQVWERINNFQSKLNVQSSTGALQDAYKSPQVQTSIYSYTRELENIPRLDEDAVGVAVGLGNEVIAIDVFSSPSVFSRLWPKLLRSYAALAVSEIGKRGEITVEDVKRIFNEVYRTNFSRQAGLDLGEELRSEAGSMVCSGLVYRQNLIHFAAFPSDGQAGPVNRGQRVPLIEID